MSKHPLEEILNADATDILTAIQKGHRAVVDVKGKLAEYFLEKRLAELQKRGIIEDSYWFDKDGVPDFFMKLGGVELKMECKNIRSKQLFRNPPAYKVELQKTRNSKDGTNTRGYRVTEFQVLAVCLFNHVKRWEYLYICTKYLKLRVAAPEFLEIMQPVPINPTRPWHTDLAEALKEAVSKK